MKRIGILLSCVLVLTAAPVRADEPPTLEFGLGREASKILQQLRNKGYHNVGVLKFLLAREGQDKFSDSVGTLNLLLARRLEVALIVKNSPTEPIGIIENASAVAERIPGATHLTREGLDKLFAAEYPLAWGKERVKPDALVVGSGMISQDLRTLTLGLHVLDAKTRKPQPLTRELVVRLRPEHLSETGDSFHRGAFDGGDAEPDRREKALLEDARKVRQGERPHPVRDAEAPFTLQVLYDGKPQTVEIRDGQAWIAEPSEKQEIVLRFTRQDSSDRVFGVVLKVNGENTLFREKLPDAQCRCWLNYPEDRGKAQDKEGFQVRNDKVEKFRVASRAESKEREVYYGSDVGTITLTVFPERRGKAPRPPRDFEQKDELLIRRSELPSKEKPSTFAKLQQTLYQDLDRGLITEGGQVIESHIEVIPFQRDPTPVMTLTLHYYRK